MIQITALLTVGVVEMAAVVEVVAIPRQSNVPPQPKMVHAAKEPLRQEALIVGNTNKKRNT